MFSSLRRLAADRRGTAALEFGIVGLIFVTLLLGAVDLSRYQITQQSVRSIAEEGARSALITVSSAAVQGSACGTMPSSAALKSAVTTPVNPAPMLAVANLTLTPVCALSGSGVRVITVTATYPFVFTAPILTSPPNLTASASLSY